MSQQVNGHSFRTLPRKTLPAKAVSWPPARPLPAAGPAAPPGLRALTHCPACNLLVQRSDSRCSHCRIRLSGEHTLDAGPPSAGALPAAGARRRSPLALTALIVGLASLLIPPLAPFAVALGGFGVWVLRGEEADSTDRRWCHIGLSAGAVVLVAASTALAVWLRASP